MRKLFILPIFVLALITTYSSNVYAKDEPLRVKEFRQLYDSLLTGKTLVTETTQDGVIVKK
ncbi:MAG: hypothetical protein HW396_1687, partial [Candidatus Dadabacteria bacterium]|nr:hypothetical protein [Candidatus Dadabacteria bacterium]